MDSLDDIITTIQNRRLAFFKALAPSKHDETESKWFSKASQPIFITGIPQHFTNTQINT